MVGKKRNVKKMKTYRVTILGEYDFQPGKRPRFVEKFKAKSKAEALRKADKKYGKELVIASSIK